MNVQLDNNEALLLSVVVEKGMMPGYKLKGELRDLAEAQLLDAVRGLVSKNLVTVDGGFRTWDQLERAYLFVQPSNQTLAHSLLRKS